MKNSERSKARRKTIQTTLGDLIHALYESSGGNHGAVVQALRDLRPRTLTGAFILPEIQSGRPSKSAHRA